MGPSQGTPEGTPTAFNTPPGITAPTGAVGPFPVSPMAVAQLEAEIARYTRQGYMIVNRTETSAQLKRRKHFSIWWAFFWLIVGLGAGLALYLAWYVFVKRDRVVFLHITPDGRVLSSEG